MDKKRTSVLPVLNLPFLLLLLFFFLFLFPEKLAPALASGGSQGHNVSTLEFEPVMEEGISNQHT